MTPQKSPEDARFAFTIVDDTDNSTLSTVKPFYDLLLRLGMRTTKTVWVYRSRDSFFGDTVEDARYVEYLLDLQAAGFEMAIHNVGSGAFTRAEILAGLERFRETFGTFPRLLAQHGWNPDCLYWGGKRFGPLLGWFFRRFRDKGTYSGELPTSPHYWGDRAKELISYVRNYTFDQIDLNRRDGALPYHDVRKPQVNRWFSSVDGRCLDQMLHILSKPNVDRLVDERGVCILYTHVADGLTVGDKVHPELRRRLEYVAARNGTFVPASTLLDRLAAERGVTSVSPLQLMKMDAQWAIDHLKIALRLRMLGRRKRLPQTSRTFDVESMSRPSGWRRRGKTSSRT